MIPATVLHATESIIAWITMNVAHPVLIGPDAESSQWVSYTKVNPYIKTKKGWSMRQFILISALMDGV